MAAKSRYLRQTNGLILYRNSRAACLSDPMGGFDQRGALPVLAPTFVIDPAVDVDMASGRRSRQGAAASLSGTHIIGCPLPTCGSPRVMAMLLLLQPPIERELIVKENDKINVAGIVQLRAPSFPMPRQIRPDPSSMSSPLAVGRLPLLLQRCRHESGWQCRQAR